ncbi:MAG: 50S ribosomal protein L6 [Desulfovibrionaceae bacterium]
MSRIGKQPIEIPSDVTVELLEDAVLVKGPKGSHSVHRSELINYLLEGITLTLTRVNETREARERHGLYRTLIANAIIGVTKGFEKTLEVLGVGYRVAVKGNIIDLSVGFSHPVHIDIPKGISAKVEGQKLTLMGISKELVGQFSAQIRSIRKPEPYKGKGIRYEGEHVRRKAGKSGSKG